MTVPFRDKIDFSLEVKIFDIVNEAQNLFYFIIGIFSMSLTFRRAVRVQKHLFVTERGVLTELLKVRTNARSFTKLLFIANYVETITCATYGNFRKLNVQCLEVFFLSATTLRGRSFTVDNSGYESAMEVR